MLSNGNNIFEIEQTFRNITDRMLRGDVFRRSSAATRCEIHSIKFSGLNFNPTVTPQIVILTQNVIRIAVMKFSTQNVIIFLTHNVIT